MPLLNTPVVHIVDDEVSLAEVIATMVRQVGLRAETYESATKFLDKYVPNSPGCLLTDIRMPGMSGVALQQTLRDRGDTIPVIIMSGFADVSTTVRAMKSGALDVIEKGGSLQVLLEALQSAVAADTKRRKEHAEKSEVAVRYQQLTAREKEVMALVVSGKTNKEVGAALGISPNTVEIHRGRVMTKMAADSIADLVRLALAVGVEGTSALKRGA